MNALMYYMELIRKVFSDERNWFEDMRKAWDWAYQKFAEHVKSIKRDKERDYVIDNWTQFLKANLSRSPHITGGYVSHDSGVGKHNPSHVMCYCHELHMTRDNHKSTVSRVVFTLQALGPLKSSNSSSTFMAPSTRRGQRRRLTLTL
jgi:hypothetical protein